MAHCGEEDRAEDGLGLYSSGKAAQGHGQVVARLPQRLPSWVMGVLSVSLPVAGEKGE